MDGPGPWVRTTSHTQGAVVIAVAHGSPPDLTVLVHTEADRMVVAPAGDLDAATAEHLREEVTELRRAGAEHVVIDLGRLRFLDSGGLGVLLVLRNDAKRAGHAFALAPGPRQVQRVFALSGTRGLFDWSDAH